MNEAYPPITPDPDGGPAGQASPIEDGLSGPPTGALLGGVSSRQNVDLRAFALDKAIEACRGTHTNSDQIVKHARVYEAFLKGD